MVGDFAPSQGPTAERENPVTYLLLLLLFRPTLSLLLLCHHKRKEKEEKYETWKEGPPNSIMMEPNVNIFGNEEEKEKVK